MDGTRSQGKSEEGADRAAANLPTITALVVDVAAAAETHELQEALTDFVWHLLERDYQIYLCSSIAQEGGADPLAGESFVHPRLTWLRGEMPPSKAQTTEYPQLIDRTTLWISDDRKIETWVRQLGMPFVSVGRSEASFAEEFHIAGWRELAGVLDPGARALRHLAEAVLAVRRSRPPGSVLVGIGGPPESGFERLAVDLKRTLEAGAVPLVDLLDLTSFLSVGEARSGAEVAFPAGPGDFWLLETVLSPLAAGQSVYVEKAPVGIPKDFGHHFPLYLSEESVVIVLGEMVFQRPIRDKLHLAILVDVSPAETARRLYEISEGQAFDPDFTRQYLERDGRVYQNYLSRNQVFERADIRVNGNSPRWFGVSSAATVTN